MAKKWYVNEKLECRWVAKRHQSRRRDARELEYKTLLVLFDKLALDTKIKKKAPLLALKVYTLAKNFNHCLQKCIDVGAGII